MAKPHLYPDIPGLHSLTQIYTQRRSTFEAPVNYKFTAGQLANFLALEYGFGPSVTIEPNPVAYTPTPTGNLQNLGQFVYDPSSALWFIDQNGLAITFEGLGVMYWNENLYNSGVHSSRHAGHWTPETTAANADAVIQPKGIGAFYLSIGGHKRGQRSIDLQMERTNDNQTSTGPYSIIMGGSQNQAAGTLSGAAGHRAKSIHSGSFVFADNQEADFSSTQEKEFRFRFLNRINFVTNIVETNGDIEVTDWTKGIILRDSSGGRHRFTAGHDSNLIGQKLN